MRSLTYILIILAALMLVVWRCEAGTVTLPPATTRDGKPFNLNDGKLKVIYFGSNFCRCVLDCEAVSFLPLAKQYAGKVEFVDCYAGSFDLHYDPTQFDQLVATHNLTYPLVLDKSHAVADALGATAFSECYLIDGQGRILYSGAADNAKAVCDAMRPISEAHSWLTDALKEYFAGQSITVPYNRAVGCRIDK